MHHVRQENLPFVGSSHEFVGAEQGDTNGLNDLFIRDTCFAAPAPCSARTVRISINQDGT